MAAPATSAAPPLRSSTAVVGAEPDRVVASTLSPYTSRPAAASKAVVGGLRGRTALRVGLRAGWKVTAARQVVIGRSAMACAVTALVRVRKKPATAATVTCVGKPGSAGLTYRLPYRVGKVKLAVAVRFPPPRYTLAQLTAVAPLPAITGAMVGAGGIQVLRPTGWQSQVFSNSIEVATTDSACQVFVFFPAARAGTGVDALQQQLYGIVSTLYPAGTVGGEYGVPDAYTTQRRGTTGFGTPWVGLQLASPDGSQEIDARLAVIGSQVVALAQIGVACRGRNGGEVASLRHTLVIPGAANKPGTYAVPLRGEWTLPGSTAVGVDIYAANGHYIRAAATQYLTTIGGNVYTVSQSWAGDGNYLTYGPILATFAAYPGARASSELIEIYDEFQKVTGQTTRYQCSLFQYESNVSDACLYKTG
jgi:hypothetical protein